MTFLPDQIGDKGQRYEISFRKSKDTQERLVMGWSETLERARRGVNAINAHPSWVEPRIWDREKKEYVP